MVTGYQTGASTIQDASSLQTGFYCKGPKLSLSQWHGANHRDNQKPKHSVYCSIHLFTLRPRSGNVSVQPQLSLEAGWALVLLFLIFHRWQSLKEGFPIGMQQKGENPNEGIYPICQHCLVSQLHAGHAAGLTDKMDDSIEKF